MSTVYRDWVADRVRTMREAGVNEKVVQSFLDTAWRGGGGQQQPGGEQA